MRGLISIQIAFSISLPVFFIAGCDSSPIDEDPPQVIQDNLPLESGGEPVAFVDVAVVPMDFEGVVEHQTVLVSNGLITAIGHKDSVAVDPSYVTVPGEGRRYLMPGLADMHVHLNDNFSEVRNDHIVFLANGITTIRTMWGLNSRVSLSERDAIEEGSRLGPTIYAASPGMDGSPGPWNHLTPPVETAAEARALVREYQALGYDFIKVYSNLSPNVYDAILAEAANVGIPVVGHVPWEVGLPDAIESGQATMEHLHGFGISASSSGNLNTGELDLAKVDATVALSIDAGAWFTPTIIATSRTQADVVAAQSSSAYRYISPTMRSRFLNGQYQGTPDAIAAKRKRNNKTVVQRISAVGGNLLLGTDAGWGWVLQGASIHIELGHLVEAGMTPYQALMTGTIYPATFLGSNGGVVAVGRRADLILLDDNPLNDAANVKDTRKGVMVNGRWFSSRRLNQMLEDIRNSYAGS